MKMFLILLLLWSNFSCNEEVKRSAEPKNLIPIDTLVLVLKDLSIIEAHAKLNNPNVLSNYKTLRKSGQYILDEFHLDTARFDSSMKYYSSRQQLMQSIFTQVADSINKELTELKAL